MIFGQFSAEGPLNVFFQLPVTEISAVEDHKSVRINPLTNPLTHPLTNPLTNPSNKYPNKFFYILNATGGFVVIIGHIACKPWW